MLAPQLATTLCLVATDAAVTPKALQEALGRAVQKTLNMVSVDGEMSTNDCVLVLANGLAGNPRISEPGPDLDVLENALTDLFGELARAMAADGEGATKMMEVVVTGAPERGDRARLRPLHHRRRPLVKAALFGADPNWGRVLSTVGARAGAQGWPIDPFKARVTLQGVTVFGGGAPIEFDREALRARMRESRVDVLVELGRGEAARDVVGLRPLLRLREDQRRLHLAHLPEGGRRGREGRPRLALHPRASSRRCSSRRSSTSPPSPARSPSSSTAARRW